MVPLIPTRVHGGLDYLFALALIASPWVFGFEDDGIAMWLPVILGIFTLFYSAMTDYEPGAIRVLPFSMHLVLDTLSGIILVASPWVFGFADDVWIPHVAFGVFELIAVSLSGRRPAESDDRLLGRSHTPGSVA